MAIVTGSEYDHIDLRSAAGGDITRHMLKDAQARQDNAAVQSAMLQKQTVFQVNRDERTGGVNYLYGFIEGRKYRLINKSETTINAFLYDGTQNVQEIGTAIGVNGIRDFVATASALYLRIFSGAAKSVIVYPQEYTELADPVDAYTKYDESILVNQDSTGPLELKYRFIAGRTYTLRNTSDTHQFNAFTRNGTTNVDTIKSPLRPGESVTFTPTVDAEILRISSAYPKAFVIMTGVLEYVAGRLGTELESIGENQTAMTQRLDAIASTLSVEKTVSNAVNYPYAFKAGKRYVFTNTSTEGALNAFTRNGTANAETIKSQIQPGEVVVFIPTVDAEMLRVFSAGPVTFTLTYDSIENIGKYGNVIMNPSRFDYLYGGTELIPIRDGTDRVARMYALWDELVAQHGTFLTKSVLGRDQSDTYDINCYTLRSYSDVINSGHANPNLKFVWVAAVHGVEADATRACYLFVKDLLERRDRDENLRMIWDNVTLVIVPIANPWGYQNVSRYNSRGVNINRNFSYRWQYVDPATDQYNYGGTEPMSEAETKIIDDLVSANMDAFCVINHHGSSTLTVSGGTICYASSRFYAEKEAQQNIARVLDGTMKNAYPWLVTDQPANAKVNMVHVTWPNLNNRGTMDEYVNMVKGKNGFLLEIATGLGTDYPSGTDLELQNLQTTAAGSYVIGYTLQNMAICADRKTMTD